MKNTQKGFVIPLVIAIVVILIAGGIYLSKKGEVKNVDFVTDTNLNQSIISVTPSSASIGSTIKIRGTNFDPISPEFTGNGWLTNSHTIVKIVPQDQGGKGFTGILWEGGSQGGKQITSSSVIDLTIPAKICEVSIITSPTGCPSDKLIALIPGTYGIKVWVDGRGETDWANLTITSSVSGTQSDWKLYENNSVGFFIMYPPSWKVNEYKNEKTGLFSRIGFNDRTKIQDIWSVSLFYPPKWTEEKFIEEITQMLGNNIQKKEVATDLGASGATKMIIVIDGKTTEYLIGNDGSKVYNITGPSSPEFTSFYQSFRLVQ